MIYLCIFLQLFCFSYKKRHSLPLDGPIPTRQSSNGCPYGCSGFCEQIEFSLIFCIFADAGHTTKPGSDYSPCDFQVQHYSWSSLNSCRNGSSIFRA